MCQTAVPATLVQNPRTTKTCEEVKGSHDFEKVTLGGRVSFLVYFFGTAEIVSQSIWRSLRLLWDVLLRDPRLTDIPTACRNSMASFQEAERIWTCALVMRTWNIANTQLKLRNIPPATSYGHTTSYNRDIIRIRYDQV